MISTYHSLRIESCPAVLQGKIALPTSKSISNRILIINALAGFTCDIENLSDSDDTRVMLAALYSPGPVTDIGHAGTAMRFLTAYFAITPGERTLTGSERMKQRPVKVLTEALRQLGAKIEYLEKEGFPPLKITGTSLKGGQLELDGSVSSQYVSALLMIAPTLEGGLGLRLKNRIASRSYIEMTLRLMEKSGISYSWENQEIRIPEQKYRISGFSVEADWSAASYWYLVLALCNSGKIELQNLRRSGLQGDEAVSRWFESFGIQTYPAGEGLTLVKNEDFNLPFLSLDFSENPDIAQTMSVLCVARGIPFHFTGLETLKIKETDRIAALRQELEKFGAQLMHPEEGVLTWDGRLHSGAMRAEPVIDTYNDHRMAMAFAPMVSTGRPLIINNPQVVTKSYPGFWDDLRSVGFTLSPNEASGLDKESSG